MYLTKAFLKNIGPIKSVVLTPKFDEAGRPDPIVVVGSNGSGKSILLAAIMDAMVEARKLVWRETPDVPPDQFLRYLSSGYVRSGTNYLHTEIAFGTSALGVVQHEFATQMNKAAFDAVEPEFRFLGAPIQQSVFDSGGLEKKLVPAGNVKNEIEQEVLLYYPYFRYAEPAWLNKGAAPSIAVKQAFVGQTDNHVLMTNIVTETVGWLFDTVFDMEAFERQIAQMMMPVQGGLLGQSIPVNVFRGFDGPNSRTLALVRKILTEIIRSANPQVEYARIGITNKVSRSISVMVKYVGQEGEHNLAPDVRQLSSGELMAFCLFCSIIRAYETVTGQAVSSLDAIKGVVLIDEIDLHLHIRLQMDLIPKMVAMFPNVQFVMTTHSPFLVLGLTKVLRRTEIVLLPQGMQIAPDAFSEFQSAYDVFVGEDQQYKARYEELSAKAIVAAAPLVITEGKTDWKHLKAAMARLTADGQIAVAPIEFHEYEDRDMGDSQLSKICESAAALPNHRKLIFVFDRDKPDVVSKMGSDQLGYKAWGNNVYSLCIPMPAHRAQYQKISIEFFYTDDEIRTIDATTGRRLFFDNEILETGTPGYKKDGWTVLDVPRADRELSKKIYDQDCDNIMNAAGMHLAHSKAVFASRVLGAADGFSTFGVQAFLPLLQTIATIAQLP